MARKRETFPGRGLSNAPVEITRWREPKARHFLNADGTFTAEVFRDSLFYRDPRSHAMLPIDNGLKATGKPDFAYANGANRFSAQFASKPGTSPLSRIALGDSALEFKPLNATGSPGEARGNSITYKGAYPGVDLRYDVLSDRVKEAMVLASPDSPTTYTFALTLTNLTFKPRDDGSIAFFAPGEEQPTFLFPKPFMYEAGDESVTSEQVTQRIRQEAGQLYLEIAADSAWLKEPGRKFPVVLDPTTEVNPDAASSKDTFVSSANPTTSYFSHPHLVAGTHATYGTTRSYLWFKLPALPDGARIDSAKVSLYMYYKDFTDTTNIEIRRVNSDWTSSSLTWNNQPAVSNVAESDTPITGPGWYDLWVSKLVTDWYSAAQRNYGVELQAAPESANRRSFESGDSTNLAPKLIINYTIDPVGDQRFWAYVGGVNPFNGNLMAKAVDLFTPGRGIPVSITRTYNSRASEQTGLFGYGWSSNLDMRIAHTGWAPPLFWDATGTRHVFQDNGDGTFSPPPGIHYGLKWDNLASVYQITTVDNSVYTFNSSGLLTQATDANGNTTVYTRDASGKLTKITDAAGRPTTITYNAAGLIATITDPAGRTALYQYDSSGNLLSVEVKQGANSVRSTYDYVPGSHRLKSVTDPKLQQTTITYDGSNRVATITQPEGAVYTYQYDSATRTGTVLGPQNRKATYVFNDNGNLTQADVTLDPTTGATARISYTWDTTNHLTSITDSNGHTTTLDYNDSGQPVQITDPVKITSTLNYDAHHNLTDAKNPLGDVAPSTYDAKNNLTESSDELGNATMLEVDGYGNRVSTTLPISLADNLVTNPGFEEGTNGWLGIDGALAVADRTKKSGGDQSVRLLSTSAAVKTDYAIPVVGGAHYTLSADVLTDSAAALRVHWRDAAGNELAPSPENLSTTTNSWGNWRRKSTHVDAPAAAATAQVELVLTSPGSAWFDNVQFETGTGRWGSNALVNPDFDWDRDATGLADFWYPPNPNPGGISIDFGTSHSGMASEKIVGAVDKVRYVGEEIDLAGDSTTKLAFSGWAKSLGGTAGQGQFALQVDLFRRDTPGTPVGSFSVDFDPTNSAWHKRTSVITAPAAFDYVKVYAFYANQTGTAWFDDFELHKFNPTASTVSSFNYVENGSMELDQDKTLWPDGWQRYPSPSYNATYTRENSGFAYTGERSISIANPTGLADLYQLQKIPYDPAKTYTALGYVKTTGFAGTKPTVRLAVHFYDSADGYKGVLTSPPITSDTDWSRLSQVISGNAPAGSAYMRVGVQMTAGTGKVYVDNLRLLEGEKRTTLAYDANGNYVTTIKNPLGETITHQVDANTGNVTRVQKPLGSAYRYGYDWLNRLNTATYAYLGTDRTFAYGYDANSNLQTVADPNGVLQWTFAYNGRNQLTSAKERVNGSQQETQMAYDSLGSLAKVTSPNGAFKQLTYDNANRVTKVEYGNGAVTGSFAFQYDAAGNLTAYSSPYGNSSLTYDDRDRLTGVTLPFNDGSHSLAYTYDAAGRPTGLSLTTPIGGWSANYQYDARSLVSRITENRFGKNAWYLYNEAGQVVKSYAEYNSGGYATFLAYDPVGRVTELLTQNSSGQVSTLLRYRYDQNGNVTRIYDDMAGKYVIYSYDELDQLTKEEYWTTGAQSADTTIAYTYDELGNRTSVTKNGVKTTYTYNPEKNRLTAVGGASYTYDTAGNLKSDGANTYAWDEANRLQQVKTSTSTISFTYDALGRRASKTVNGSARYYHYEGKRVAYVTDGSGGIAQIFTYDGAGRPLYLHQNGTLYQYHYNAHGDVIRLTDMNGAVVAAYQYDAWGNITSQTGALADSNPYRYAGYWYDQVWWTPLSRHDFELG